MEAKQIVLFALGIGLLLFAGWLAYQRRSKAALPWIFVGLILVLLARDPDVTVSSVNLTELTAQFSKRTQQATREIREQLPSTRLSPSGAVRVSSTNFTPASPNDPPEPILEMQGKALMTLAEAGYLFSRTPSRFPLGTVFTIQNSEAVPVGRVIYGDENIKRDPITLPDLSFESHALLYKKVVGELKPADKRFRVPWVATKFQARALSAETIRNPIFDTQVRTLRQKPPSPLYLVVEVVECTEAQIGTDKSTTAEVKPFNAQIGYRAVKLE